MTVELVPRPKARPKRIVNVLFYLSLVFLVLAVGSYLFLYSLNEKKEQELVGLREDLANQETKELTALKNKLMRYEEKIEDLTVLVESYREPTKLFKFLEGVTHPKVMWLAIKLDLKEGKVALSGDAANLTSLIQQILFLEGESRIGDLELTSFQLLEGGGASFNIDFSPDPGLYK